MADSSGTPTELVIDYEVLHDAANKLDSLESDVHTIGKIGTVISYGFVPSNGAGGGEYADSLGPEPFGRALSNFYGQWQDPLSSAGDQIKKLSATFRGIAQAYFDADASQVSAITAGVALSAARNYPAEVAAYVQAMAEWEKLPNGGVNVPYYDANGVEHYETIPQPTPPSFPGSTMTDSGATTTWTTGGTDPNDPNQGPLITSETTTYTDDGMAYTETTTFGPDQGWENGGPTQNTTTTITHSDGSTDTITTDYTTNGNATSTDVNVSNGKSTTTVETRDGWDGSWNTMPPPPPPPDAAGDSPHYQK